MTDPASPSGPQVNQADYIAALEDDVARESRARRILQALVNQRTRTLSAYIERFGDITEGAATEQEGDPDGAATAAR